MSDLEMAIRRLLRDVLIDVAREVLPRARDRSMASSGRDLPDEPLLLRGREAAKLLSISERLLFSLTKDGTIPCVRLGSSVRYSFEDLRALASETAPRELKRKPLSASRTTHQEVAQQENAALAGQQPIHQAAPKPVGKSTSKKRATTRPTAQRGRKVSTDDSPQRGEAEGDISHKPRLITALIGERLGVSQEDFPRLTNGDIMRIAEIDTPTLHGWTYLGREMPEEAIERLCKHFAAYFGHDG